MLDPRNILIFCVIAAGMIALDKLSLVLINRLIRRIELSYTLAELRRLQYWSSLSGVIFIIGSVLLIIGSLTDWWEIIPEPFAYGIGLATLVISFTWANVNKVLDRIIAERIRR